MTHMLQLLPALACGGLMFGAGAIAWLGRKTPLGRVPWLANLARRIRHQEVRPPGD